MALLGVVRVQVARRGAAGDGRLFDGRRHRRGHRRRDRRDRRLGPVGRCRRRHHAVLDRRPRRGPRDAAPGGPELGARPGRGHTPRAGRCGRWPGCAPSPSACASPRPAACGSTRPSASARPSCRSVEMLDDMATTDVHPPLHHALLWVTVRVFGTSEFAVRLPSLIAGVALVPVLYWVGRGGLRQAHRLGGRDAGGDRPVLRVVLAGGADVRAVHAARRRRRRRPGPGDPARAARGLGALRPGVGAPDVDAVLRRAPHPRPAAGVRLGRCEVAPRPGARRKPLLKGGARRR